MKAKASPKTVRRSVALSRQLLEVVSALAPQDLRQNFNRLVTVALQEFAARQTAWTFEEAMRQMATDPAIRAECAAIAQDLSIAEADGLKDDQPRPDAKNEPRDYPTNVRMTVKETGLPRDTVFLCFQGRSLDPARFFDLKTHRPNLAGSVPWARMTEVETALRVVLSM